MAKVMGALARLSWPSWTWWARPTSSATTIRAAAEGPSSGRCWPSPASCRWLACRSAFESEVSLAQVAETFRQPTLVGCFETTKIFTAHTSSALYNALAHTSSALATHTHAHKLTEALGYTHPYALFHKELDTTPTHTQREAVCHTDILRSYVTSHTHQLCTARAPAHTLDTVLAHTHALFVARRPLFPFVNGFFTNILLSVGLHS